MVPFSIFLAFGVLGVHGGVIELTDSNFDSRLSGKKGLVMFYSPSCGHCMRFKPTFEALAARKSMSANDVLMIKVDCTDAGKKTCQKYAVSGYPTIKFISRVDEPEFVDDYNGNRELSHVEGFVLDNCRESIVEVHEDEVPKFVESTTLPVAFGFFKDSKSKLFQKLQSMAGEYKKKFIFGYSFSADVAKKMGHPVESIVIYRQQQYKSPLDTDVPVCTRDKELPVFLKQQRFSIVEYKTPENEEDFKMPMITAFVPIDPAMQRSSAKRLRNVMVKQALQTKDITFTVSKRADYEEFIKDLAPAAQEKDIQLVAFDDNGKKYLSKEVPSVDDPKAFEEILQKFVADFKKGDVLEQFVKSEPIPSTDDGHVKVVVGKTFDSIVIDNDKDVLIEFYAPWCGHCKKLAPIYQQLATVLKDEPNLVIAKYDATANDAQKNFPIEGFPTIYLAKAGKKTAPIQYSGPRDAAGIIKWLKRETTHGVKFDGKVPELKEEL